MSYAVLACVCAVLAMVVFCAALYQTLKLPQLPRYKVDAFIARAMAGPLAHRGGRPENTVCAITKSSQLGAVGIEVDLAFTKDGEAVLLHDERIDRTSNGSGRVHNMTLKQLKQLDFGVKSGGPAFAGVTIPTLDEAVKACEELDLLMLLEIKGHGDSHKALETVKKLFSMKPALYSRIAVVSFYPNVVYKVRKQDKNLLVGLISRCDVLSTRVDGCRRNDEWWKHVLAVCVDKLLTFSINTWLWRVLGISLLLANKNDILNGRVCPPSWKSRGVNVIGWTVNSVQEKNHFKYLLKIPYMSDNVAAYKSVPEQSS